MILDANRNWQAFFRTPVNNPWLNAPDLQVTILHKISLRPLHFHFICVEFLRFLEILRSVTILHKISLRPIHFHFVCVGFLVFPRLAIKLGL